MSNVVFKEDGLIVPFQARPVLMSNELAAQLGLTDRLINHDAQSGVVWLTEADLLAFGAARVEWHEPDANGWYTPTLYTGPRLP